MIHDFGVFFIVLLLYSNLCRFTPPGNRIGQFKDNVRPKGETVSRAGSNDTTVSSSGLRLETTTAKGQSSSTLPGVSKQATTSTGSSITSQAKTSSSKGPNLIALLKPDIANLPAKSVSPGRNGIKAKSTLVISATTPKQLDVSSIRGLVNPSKQAFDYDYFYSYEEA